MQFCIGKSGVCVQLLILPSHTFTLHLSQQLHGYGSNFKLVVLHV